MAENSEDGAVGLEAVAPEVGQRTLFSEAVCDAACEAAEEGLSMADTAASATICERSLYKYLAIGRDDADAGRDTPHAQFAQRFACARMEGRRRDIGVIRRHGDEDWRALAWLLERNGYARPAEVHVSGKVEHDHRHRLELSMISAAVERVEDAELLPAGLLTAGENGGADESA